MGFRYIEPLYGYDSNLTHIAVSEKAEKALLRMVEDLLGTDYLIAIYIPEGTEDVYQPGAMRGRVVGGVKLLPMPTGKVTGDYFYKDWDGTIRWPLGWPCKAVYAPPVSQCPVLRTRVEMLFGPNNFQSYVARFQHGPFGLETRMAADLDKFFTKFSKLP